MTKKATQVLPRYHINVDCRIGLTMKTEIDDSIQVNHLIECCCGEGFGDLHTWWKHKEEANGRLTLPLHQKFSHIVSISHEDIEQLIRFK